MCSVSTLRPRARKAWRLGPAGLPRGRPEGLPVGRAAAAGSPPWAASARGRPPCPWGALLVLPPTSRATATRHPHLPTPPPTLPLAAAHLPISAARTQHPNSCHHSHCAHLTPPYRTPHSPAAHLRHDRGQCVGAAQRAQRRGVRRGTPAAPAGRRRAQHGRRGPGGHGHDRAAGVKVPPCGGTLGYCREGRTHGRPAAVQNPPQAPVPAPSARCGLAS